MHIYMFLLSNYSNLIELHFNSKIISTMNHWHVFLSFLFITIKFCFADNDNLQDFCPASFPDSDDCDDRHNHTTIFINGFPCKNPANITGSDFKTSKLQYAGDTDNLLQSSTTIVTAAELPGLNTLGLALGRIDMEEGGFVSIHSHPRAAEMMFVSRGVVTVGFIDTANEVFQKILKEGDVFIVPKAMQHYCYNSGFEAAVILSVHNSQNPGLSDIIGNLLGSGSEAAMKLKQSLASLSQKKADYHGSRTTVADRHTEL